MVKGVDRFQRPFICLPVTSKYNGNSVITIFQRYTDSECTWVVGEYDTKSQRRPSNCKCDEPFHITSGGSSIVCLEYLKLLVEGKHSNLTLIK